MPLDLDHLSNADLKALVIALLGEVHELKQQTQALRAEIAQLKGLKGPPSIKPGAKPSGMEAGTDPRPPGTGRNQRRRGKASQRRPPETRILTAGAPAGSRFKGYEDFLVQDVLLQATAVLYRREHWAGRDGQTFLAPLPAGISGHFGPELQRLVLNPYHPSQVTVPRLATLLDAIGIDISKRQIMRLLTEAGDDFRQEAERVLRAGLANAGWISVDDTGARHKGANGYCTQIGNDDFTFFSTTAPKSRLNFLGLLRAGFDDFVVDAEALDYMRNRALSGHILRLLADHPVKHFADHAAWRAHLECLGLPALQVAPNPVLIATEGALWGAIKAHGLLQDAVILSDDAGQFNIGRHALCWVHAGRLVHKLVAFTEAQRQAQQATRGLIWDFYADLKAYRLAPGPAHKRLLSARFTKIFKRKTGYALVDETAETPSSVSPGPAPNSPSASGTTSETGSPSQEAPPSPASPISSECATPTHELPGVLPLLRVSAP